MYKGESLGQVGTLFTPVNISQGLFSKVNFNINTYFKEELEEKKN